MRRILVLRGGALGDFIVTLPALAALRARWPQARIELAGNLSAGELGRVTGLLDAGHSQHQARWSALFGTEPLPREFAAWLGEFDLVVNFWPDPEGELRRRFPARDGQVFISAPAMPTIAPAAAHYCATLREVGIETREFFVPIRAGQRPALPQAIAMHPGSGSPKKNWPEERWIELIATLSAPVVLVLGEAEQWSASSLARLGSHVLILRDRPILSLPAELTQCRLFLGHDSGISHLAAACGVPSILLFGPTDPAMWAPPAPHVHVIRGGAGLNSITIDAVRTAISIQSAKLPAG